MEIVKPQTAKKLLKLNYDLYEHQVRSFSDTRSRGVWEREVLDFVEKIDLGSSVLDLGCGNARLYEKLSQNFPRRNPLKNLKTQNYSGVLQNIGIEYLGIDSSKIFIKKNQKKFGQKLFEVGDGLTMKFRNRFDYIICIAVLHHIPSEKLQLKFLKNIHQALRPKGKALISVWNRWTDRYKRYFDQKKPFSDMAYSDIIVPWKQTKYMRYVHAFKPTELKNLAQKAGYKNIKCFASKHGKKSTLREALNIYLIGEK